MKRFSFASFAASLALAALLPLLFSCDREIDEVDRQEWIRDSIARANDPHYEAKVYYRDNYFNPYYYWVEEQLSYARSLKPARFADIYSYFDAMLYEKDRWSWMLDGGTFVSSETGTLPESYGITLGQGVEYYGDYSVKVAYLYPDSPFARAGVTRGWTLTHIDGRTTDELIRAKAFNAAFEVSPQRFTMRDPAGETHELTLSAETLSVSPVLEAKVFTADDFPGLEAPVGYFHYLSFKANFLEEIDRAMAIFKSAGVRCLILDLRYNGGGDSRASQRLVDFLAPASARGEVYVRRVHNKGNRRYDMTSVAEGIEGALDLERLYVITGHGSASASEMVTNGLRPLMPVKMVGDTTYGKPNGMYVFYYPNSRNDQKRYENNDYSTLEWVFLPICFYNMNGAGESIPDEGFIPDNYRPDDLYHDFTVEEDNIRACLVHLTTGVYPALPPAPLADAVSVRGAIEPARLVPLSERDPHYGADWVRPYPFSPNN